MKYKRTTDSLLQTEIDSGLALLDIKSHTYFLLNDTGTLVWSQLKQERSLDELCEAVSLRFDVSTEGCKTDVSNLLAELTSKGWVVLDDENFS